MDELLTKSIAEIRPLLRDRKVSAEELTRASLDRIAETEGSLGALITVSAESALESARRLDAEGFDESRPLWGIPVTVKDALSTKGIATTAGSRILSGYVPPFDAFAVAGLKQAGAIILGKNNMDEFAMGSSCENSAWKKTVNPWDAEHVPGGSSGGSAASVAACQCFASLGTDTGGSIRQPASFCGCVGLKPTYGRVSRFGVIAYASSLDQVGPFARTAEDAASVLAAIAGHDPRDSTSSPEPSGVYLEKRGDLKGLTIGLPREFYESEGMDPAVTAVCRDAIREAERLGAKTVPVSMPHLPYSIASYYIIATAEASSNLARFDGIRYGRRSADPKDIDEMYTRSRTEGFGPEVQRRILLGTFVLSSGYYDAYYRKAAQVRRLIRADYESALKECDCMLAPVSPVPAWKIGGVTDPLQMYRLDIFTLSLNLAGLPGLSVPVGSANGLPVGMQIMGRAFDEKTLLSAGHALTNALGTAGQHAPL